MMVLEDRMKDTASQSIYYGSSVPSHNPCYFSSYGDLKVCSTNYQVTVNSTADFRPKPIKIIILV